MPFEWAINKHLNSYRSPANREKLIFHRFFGPFWSIYGHFLGICALWANFFPSFAESNCQALTKWILGGHSEFTFWNMGPRVLSRFSLFVNVLNTQNFVRIFPFSEYLHIIYRWKDTVIGYQISCKLLANSWSVSHRSISKSTPRTENFTKFRKFENSKKFEFFFCLFWSKNDF